MWGYNIKIDLKEV